MKRRGQVLAQFCSAGSSESSGPGAGKGICVLRQVSSGLEGLLPLGEQEQGAEPGGPV